MDTIIDVLKKNLVAALVSFTVLVVLSIDLFDSELSESDSAELLNQKSAKIDQIKKDLDRTKKELNAALTQVEQSQTKLDPDYPEQNPILLSENVDLRYQVNDLREQLQKIKTVEINKPNLSRDSDSNSIQLNNQIKKIDSLESELLKVEARLEKSLMTIDQIETDLDSPVNVKSFSYELERCGSNKRKKACILEIKLEFKFSRASEVEIALEIKDPKGKSYVEHKFFPKTEKTIRLKISEKFIDTGTYRIELTKGKKNIFSKTIFI
ncbi:MAG: hypothetical protein ACJA2O_003990 [Candidatus Azotimanducaceae bacterium]|jgi:hypothetical protein